MNERLRNSGIDFVGSVPWGTHFCQFYQTKEDLIEILVPYFKAGLENNEYCVWVTSEPLEVEEAKEVLKKSVHNLDVYLEKGQIEIISCTHWYLKDGVFDQERLSSKWVEKVGQALNNGYDGLRLTGNTFWLEKKDWKDFVDYEEQGDRVVVKCPVLALCTYCLDRFSTTEIIDIATNHQPILVKEEGKWKKIESSWRRNAEEDLHQSEQRIRGKLENILSPVQQMANLELAEIIDTKAIQSLMDDFHKFAHVTIGIVDLKGNVLVGVGWQEICTGFHRVHPEACKHCIESDTKLSAGVAPGEFKLYRCKNNMWDVATPIMVGSHHLGNIFSGQFFFEDEVPDYELFRSQARKYGFNEEEYIAALEKVPRLSREYMDTVMSFFMKFAHMISQLSYINVKLAQSLEERNSLVEVLRESEERFRSVLENSLDAAYRRNLQTDLYDYMSPAIEQITGFSAREMSAMSTNEVLGRIHPDDRSLVTKELGLAFDAGRGTIEYRFRHKDGKYRWFADHFTVIKDRNAVPLFNGGIVRNITEHKEAEEALMRSENKFRTLAENSPDVITRFDRQNRHLYVNPAAAEPYGRAPEKIIGKTHTELEMEPEKVKFWEEHHEKVFATGKPETMEFRYKSPTGREYYFNTQIVPEFVNGKVTSVLAISRDITDIKEAEARLKEAYENLEKLVEERTGQLEKAYKSLKESEKGLAEAQKMAHIGNWEWDIATDKAYWSEEMYRIFGRDPKKLAPSYNEYLCYIHPDDRDYYCNAIKKAATGSPFGIDYRIVLANGEERIVHLESEFILNNENTPVRIKGITQDITERKKAEKALENLETARKKEIHHRIKNNLQVISSLLDLQAEKFRGRKHFGDSEVLKAFRESQDRVMSIALIHEELHEGKGNDTLNFSQYLKSLAENLFQTYRLGNTGTELNIDLEENVFFDMDTAVPLGLIVNELVSNSFKHAFKGGDKGSIQIKLCRKENTKCTDIQGTNNIHGSKKEGCKSINFILIVSDNGVGMPENFNSENCDTLGMQLVTTLVDQLDGELELKKDSGTELIIRFAIPDRNVT